MNLIDLIKEINEVDENLIIFLEDKTDVNSEIVLSDSKDNDKGAIKINGKEYTYLLEVFLAKEFIEDWIQSIGYQPNENDIALRLYQYAINDA